MSQAERLAQHNREYRKLNVKVVSLEDIYAEFSTGRKDIGAMKIMKLPNTQKKERNQLQAMLAVPIDP